MVDKAHSARLAGARSCSYRSRSESLSRCAAGAAEAVQGGLGEGKGGSVSVLPKRPHCIHSSRPVLCSRAAHPLLQTPGPLGTSGPQLPSSEKPSDPP